MLVRSLQRRQVRQPALSVMPRLKPHASMGAPFDAAGQGRRAAGWVTTRLGLNTLLFSSGETLLSRSRDSIRNNPWASAACDSYVANAISTGIRLVHQHPDPAIQLQIMNAWNRWTKESDIEYEPANVSSGQSDFYGQQAIAAREVMEAGEVFARFVNRPASDGLSVPLQLQILECEQLPLYRNSPGTQIKNGNVLRMGIEYNPQSRREAYHFYKAHPYETMFYPQSGLELDRIPAKDILHVYKPIRAGQMRGQPWMANVLATLYELDQYQDAEIVRKKTASMLTGFITKTTPEGQILPEDTNGGYYTPPQPGMPYDPMSAMSKLEPGTFQVLFPGENVTLSKPEDDGGFEKFMRVGVRSFAIGAGCTYEQVTGDLTGVNYSSIRAGLLEFRRKCEQFQHAVFIFQFCHPVFRRWLREAVICGALNLPGFLDDPTPYEDVRWVTPGWPWVDPLKDIQAAQMMTRGGFSSRSQIVAQQGMDAGVIDAEQAADRARTQQMKLIYDSDASVVLSSREQLTDIPQQTDPKAANEGEEDEGSNADTE
jgi:lambda family phage portal protein